MACSKPAADRNQTLRLVMLGKTGVGKSTTGNTILRQEKFKSSIFMLSETWACQLERVNINGRTIEVMDAAGLFDNRMSHEKTARDVVQAAACMHPGPHAFLLVMKIGDRFTDEDNNTYMRLKMYFNERVVHHTVLVFTHGDALTRSKITLKTYLSKVPENFKVILRECNNRVVVFNNMEPSNRRQVDDMLAVVDAMLRPINGRHYTSRVSSAISGVVEKDIADAVKAADRREAESSQYVRNLQTEHTIRTKALEQTIGSLQQNIRGSQIEYSYMLEYREQQTCQLL